MVTAKSTRYMEPEDKLTPRQQADRNMQDAVERLFHDVSQHIAIPIGTNPVPSPVGKRIRISGVVTDEAGLPVEGVSLGLGGDEVKTDSEGRFTIDGVVARQEK